MAQLGAPTSNTLPTNTPAPLVPDVLSVPIYAVLTLISIAIALFFCFSVQIGHASSAAVTVIIIANTDRTGMGAKSIARLIGTLIACIAMNTIFAHFVQAPWMFLITFALWMGLCVFVASIAPSPSFAYGSTMSAITVGIIAIQQINPADIFADSVDRMVVVSVGITSVWIVFGLIPMILNHWTKPGGMQRTSAKVAGLTAKPANWAKALRGGVATIFVVLIGCSFWMITTWEFGSAMFLIYGLYTANLIQMDKIVTVTLVAFIGLVVSMASAFVCLFYVMPYVNGFPMLMASLALFLAPGFLMKSHPVLNAVASLYLSIVISLVSPSNQMNYNVTNFLNEALAFVIGLGLAGVAMTLILPSSLRLPSRMTIAKLTPKAF
jgi:uncharacterized membrane protein YccC